MEKRGLMYIRVLDQSGSILYEGLAANLSFPDEAILQKCLQFFHDPQPCHIRRGAVILRMAAEIQNALEDGPLNPGQEPWAAYFSAYGDARRVEGFMPQPCRYT